MDFCIHGKDGGNIIENVVAVHFINSSTPYFQLEIVDKNLNFSAKDVDISTIREIHIGESRKTMNRAVFL
mgnify:CR=1 FL=1